MVPRSRDAIVPLAFGGPRGSVGRVANSGNWVNLSYTNHRWEGGKDDRRDVCFAIWRAKEPAPAWKSGRFAEPAPAWKSGRFAEPAPACKSGRFAEPAPAWKSGRFAEPAPAWKSGRFKEGT